MQWKVGHRPPSIRVPRGSNAEGAVESPFAKMLEWQIALLFPYPVAFTTLTQIAILVLVPIISHQLLDQYIKLRQDPS